MLVSTHAIASFLVALGLYPFFGLYSIIFFLAGFLIDIDHAIEYAISKKNINPFDAYNDLMEVYKKGVEDLRAGKVLVNEKVYFHIFHSIEFLIILGILGYFNKIIMFIFLGFLFHIALDLIMDICAKIKYRKQNFYFARDYFFIVFAIKKLRNKY